MKILPLLLVLAWPLNLLQAQITDGDTFLSEVKAALTAKDPAKLEGLAYTSGMSDADKAQWAKSRDLFFTGQEIESIAFTPLPKPARPFYIMKGKKIEPTAPPAGMVTIKYKSANNGQTSASLGYTVIDGAYWLVSSKSTDLKWAGPADVNIGFMVIGPGQDKVKITARYNASGVDILQEFDSPSTVIWGQYFSEITVASEDPATDVTLTVRENNREIYKSEPLKGAGKLVYEKKKEP